MIANCLWLSAKQQMRKVTASGKIEPTVMVTNDVAPIRANLFLKIGAINVHDRYCEPTEQQTTKGDHQLQNRTYGDRDN